MGNIADIYELSPMQQGMLFHTVASPDSGMYVEQVHCRLEGALDIDAFRRTWAHLIARHDILRSAFFWEDMEKPLQVVHDQVELPFVELDWRARVVPGHDAGGTGDTQGGDGDFHAFLERDRNRGFAVDEAPLQRFTLIHLGDQRFYFVWTFHHLLLDGWSVAILFEEAFATYAALHRGQPLHQDPPPAYRDYIAWIQAQDRSADETFWRNALAGFDEPALLTASLASAADAVGRLAVGTANCTESASASAPDPAPQGHAQRHLTLDAAASAALGDWARRERITLSTAIQGAWALLASRYGRTRDVVFGATLAERPAVLADIDRLVGLCINTLPVRAQIAPQAMPGPWLRDLQQTQSEAAQHSATSLVDIQRWSALPAGTPLFDSIIVFENYPLRDVATYQGMLHVADLHLAEHTNYALTLIVVPGDTLQLTMSYDTARFDPGAIERLLGHLQTILHAFVYADLPLGRIPMLTAAEWTRLQTWGNHQAATAAGTSETGNTAARPRCLHHAFAEQVARTPDAVAVRHRDQQLTYAQLHARGSQLAHRLQRAGVGPGTLVGLCVERSLATVTAIVGILQAGGAYVPLDPDSPAERLSFILQDAGLEHLVIHTQLCDCFATLPASVVRLDHDGQLQDEQAAAHTAPPAVDTTPRHTAYVIYTSGSTGRPKGVYIDHANVDRLFRATAPWFAFGPDDVWTLFHSYAFDFSVWELWGALLHGGCVVVVPYWVSRNPEAFRRLLAEERVTVLNQTPSAFYQLVQADSQIAAQTDAQANAQADEALALRYIIFGGEALDLARLQPWIERHGDRRPRLINMYGITETTVHVTYRPIDREDVARARGSLIGQPIPDLALAVLDDQGQPVPVGVAGELYVGGAGVSQGYLDRAELTASRFVIGGRDPATAALPAGSRWYRSGDLVRYLAGGELEYLGRIDQQIKLHGFRIELGEIESVLGQHAAVQDCAVILRQDRPGHERLVGYVVLRAGVTDDVLAFARERLPAYMVPSALVSLPALPLTINGKLDRKALPAPELDATQRHTGQRDAGPAPASPAERTMAEIWSQVLGVEVASREANFFALGGDSILAMQVVGRARAAGLALTPRLLFQEQTVAAVAAALTVGDAAADDDSGDALATNPDDSGDPTALDGEVPLTPIQRWFAALVARAPNPHHFNQSLLLDLDPGSNTSIDAGALQRALDELVRRHPALRLRWRRDDHGDWVQHHVPATAVPLDLCTVARGGDDAWNQTLAHVTARLQTGLHLQDGPVLRAALITEDSEDSQGAADPARARLFLVAHHAVIDGVSWRILLEDLAALLAGNEPLPASTPFAVWSRSLARQAASPAIESQVELWAAQIRDGSREVSREASGPAAAPHAPDVAADCEGNTRTLHTQLDAARTRALLQEVNPAYRTAIVDVLLTALVLAHHAVTRSRTLIVDLESHGRQAADGRAQTLDLDRTIGWFTSLYPVRLELPADPAAGDAPIDMDAGPNINMATSLTDQRLATALMAIKEQRRALPEGGVGYGLLRHLHPDPDVRRRLEPAAPIPVVFNYLGQLDSALGQGPFRGLAPESSGADADPATPRAHALDIAAYVRGGQLVVDWRHGSSHEVDALADAFHRALRAIIDHCTQPTHGSLAPVDVPLAGLDRAGLDALLALVRDSNARRGIDAPVHQTVADAYPLTPLQAGMLYHGLLRPDDSAYVEQVRWQLHSPLDVGAFRAAWDLVAERHAVFRTGFFSARLPRPLQVVLRRAPAPWQLIDWRHLDAGAQDRALAEFLAQDRARGFALDQAPLVRWTLIRVADAHYHCVWTHHHLLLDGWSIANVLGELLRAYTALCRHERPILPRVVPYRDYITWVLDQDMDAAQAFWRERLADIDQPTPLPAARTAAALDNMGHAADGDHGGHAEARLTLDPAHTAALTAWARSQRLTLNTLVQGAWALLLGRYGGTTRVLFGATVSGRPATLPGTEELVGLCINTTPVPVQIDAAAAPAAWLQELQDRQSAVEPHAATALTAIHGWSRIPRGQPLFESIVVFENYPVSAAVHTGADELAITDARITEQTDLPLTLIAVPGDALALQLGYSRAHYDQATAERLLRHLARLLRGLPEAPALRALDLLGPDERARIVQTWNATQAPFPYHATLVDLLAEQTARTPDAIAVSDHDQRLSYAQLHQRARTLARYLRTRGVGPESRVGVCMHRGVDMVVALLGILQAGGAYVPLDPDYPEERLAFMVADARPALVVYQQLGQQLGQKAEQRPGRPAPRPPAMNCPAIAIDADWPTIEAAAPATAPALHPDNAAYLIYTSGSTGRPKGVINTHRAIVNRLWWMQQAYDLGADDVVLQKTPYSFDVSVWELFWPLLTGARLHIARPGGHLDRRYLAETIMAERVTTIHFVPSMLQVFLEEPRLADCGSLRRVICSGEALPLAAQQRFHAASRATLYNLYGPTEAAIDVSHWTCVAEPGQQSVPIGRPIANTQLYILDRDLQPVPPGVAGELYIGGINLARGYHHRPGLSAERFLPDPHAAEPGARMYRTGDLARFREDGVIEYLGRSDFQVKIRGFRIELGEIEHALCSHPDIAESAVVASGGSGDARLVGYYTAARPTTDMDARPGASTNASPGASTAAGIDETALRAFLRQRLPDYMVPNHLIPLAAMPLGANGKLDRKALPAPARRITGGQQPRSELERALARIWSQLLGLGDGDSVDTRTSFFDLGGHSMLLMQAHARIETLLGRTIPLLVLFEHPTIESLAGFLGQTGPTVAAGSVHAGSHDAGSSGHAVASVEPALRQAAQRKQRVQQQRRRAVRVDFQDDPGNGARDDAKDDE